MKCSVCGKEVERFAYADSICSTECFEKNFWDEVIKDKGNILIDGDVYYPDGYNEKADGKWRGYGGYTFYIKLDDKLVLTNNLWRRGTIPTEHQEKLTKGKFIDKKEFDKLKADGYIVVNRL